MQSFDGIKESIKTWTERSDLSDNALNDIIFLAETTINRLLRVREMERVDVITTQRGVDRIDLPEGFIEVRPSVNSNDLIEGLVSDEETGIPTNFSIVGNSMVFYPIPDDFYEINLTYLSEVEHLSDTNTTNILTEYYPDILLYMGISQAYVYLLSEEKAALWYQSAEGKIVQANMESKRARIGPVPHIGRQNKVRV